MTQVLVPLKDLVEAKSRLSGLLRPSERRALAQAMAEDVLSVLGRHARVSHITLLSDDPGAAMLAQKYGANWWSEAELGCRGLNPLIGRACGRLLDERDEPLIVMHADLPMLDAADIDAALDAREKGGLVVGCDRAGRGTNLLAFDVLAVPEFCFGHDSCARHLESARKAGITAHLLQRPGIELDVDEAPDLKLLVENLPGCPGANTVALFGNTRLGTRLEAALENIVVADSAALGRPAN